RSRAATFFSRRRSTSPASGRRRPSRAIRRCRTESPDRPWPARSPASNSGMTPPPFRVGGMQLTMEPLEEILEHAGVMDEAGFDTIWLAEAYPWWRKHSMEARSSTALSPLVARETERLAVGWGIISPYTRHPVQIAMEARVTQEAAGPGRFYLGLGV